MRRLDTRLALGSVFLFTVFGLALQAGASESIGAPISPALPSSSVTFSDGMPSGCKLPGDSTLVPTSISRASSSAPVVHPVAFSQALYLDKVEIAFNARRTADGAVHLEGRTGDLVFRKTVQRDGQFTIELEAKKDLAVIAVDSSAIHVTHGKKTRTVVPGAADENDMDEAMKLLGESRAVRLFRVAAAAVLDSNDDSGFSSSMLLADGVVGQLTGDAGATRRVADHLARHARARLKPVAFEISCYKTWEEGVVDAANELADCAESFSWWSIWKYVCSLRWYLEIESFWWTFLACAF